MHKQDNNITFRFYGITFATLPVNDCSLHINNTVQIR